MWRARWKEGEEWSSEGYQGEGEIEEEEESSKIIIGIK